MINKRFRLFSSIALLFVASFTYAGSFTDFAENKLVDNIMRGQASGTWHGASVQVSVRDIFT